MKYPALAHTWGRFRKNPLAMAGLGFLGLMVLIAFLGPFIRPDQTINANNQHLTYSRKSPGYKINVLNIPSGRKGEKSLFRIWCDGGREIEYKEVAIRNFGKVNGRSWITPLFQQDSLILDQHFSRLSRMEGEDLAWGIPDESSIRSRIFLLGTDKFGRDLLSRLMAGISVSLSVGAIAVFISLLVGLTLGLLSGYYRGWADAVIMWFTNVVWSVPTLLLVLAITFAFGTGFWKVFLAVGLTMWVEVARITRGQVLSVREKEFIEAAKALGFNDRRIIFRHILPNILSPVIVISAANFASAILIEAGLSFLGLGAQIPVPSWGNMIREHYAYITTDLAWLALIPGFMIMLLVLSFMMIGNGLRDALDVRQS